MSEQGKLNEELELQDTSEDEANTKVKPPKQPLASAMVDYAEIFVVALSLVIIKPINPPKKGRTPP